MDNILKSWKEFQQFRGKTRRRNMVKYNNVVLSTGAGNESYEIVLEIVNGQINMEPVNPQNYRPIYLREVNMSGCNDEGTRVILNFALSQHPYVLTFGTRESKEQAFPLIRQIVEGEDDEAVPLTPPSSSKSE